MTHDDLKVGDKVYHLVTLPGENPRRVPAKVWTLRHRRRPGVPRSKPNAIPTELWAIDLMFPRGLIKEVPLEYVVLPSAVEQLGDLA